MCKFHKFLPTKVKELRLNERASIRRKKVAITLRDHTAMKYIFKIKLKTCKLII